MKPAEFVTVNINGQNVVIGAIAAADEEIRQRAREAVQDYLDRVVIRASSEAPVSSGKLIASIDKMAREKGGWVRGWVKSKARYSLYQEYGTGIAGSISNTQERPEWHRYQQRSLKQRVYTQHGWADRTIKWRGGRDKYGRKRVQTGWIVRETMGIHTPPPISQLKPWAALHGINPYALRLMIYRRQGIKAHPFLYGADRAEAANFQRTIEEAVTI